RVAFEKNIDSLFEMLRMTLIKIPEAHLVIAGEGPAKVSLMQQVKEMGLSDHVTFVGYLDRNSELIDCYHAADLFVFSSLTETQGLVLLEAMASGIPVVSVAAMGTKEVLRNDLGAKITDGTADDFSAKVIEVLDNKSLHTNLSQAAIAYAAEWDPRKLAIKMESYYCKVAFSQPPRVTP
ncbi:MAG: glycosyltransferase, partial [Pseudomonadota bacterium]|nr:glycosyltransferase [Pseudomonadota bacterium]